MRGEGGILINIAKAKWIYKIGCVRGERIFCEIKRNLLYMLSDGGGAVAHMVNENDLLWFGQRVIFAQRINDYMIYVTPDI